MVLIIRDLAAGAGDLAKAGAVLRVVDSGAEGLAPVPCLLDPDRGVYVIDGIRGQRYWAKLVV